MKQLQSPQPHPTVDLLTLPTRETSAIAAPRQTSHLYLSHLLFSIRQLTFNLDPFFLTWLGLFLLNPFFFVFFCCVRFFYLSRFFSHRPSPPALSLDQIASSTPIDRQPSVHRQHQASAAPPPTTLTAILVRARYEPLGLLSSHTYHTYRTCASRCLSHSDACSKWGAIEVRICILLFCPMPSPEAPGGGRFGGRNARVMPRHRAGPGRIRPPVCIVACLAYSVHQTIQMASLRCLVIIDDPNPDGPGISDQLDCQGLGIGVSAVLGTMGLSGQGGDPLLRPPGPSAATPWCH